MFKHGFNYAAESNHKLVQSGLPRPTSPAEELPGFIDERMLEGTGVSIKRQCLEPKSSSRISPAGNRREHFAEDFLRLGGLQAKVHPRFQSGSALPPPGMDKKNRKQQHQTSAWTNTPSGSKSRVPSFMQTTNASPTPKKRMRWWIPAIIISLAVANIVRVRAPADLDTMTR